MQQILHGGPFLARLATGLVAAAVLSSCGDRSVDSEPAPFGAAEPVRGGTVVIAAGVDITGVNELTGTETRMEQDVIDLLFLKLFREQPDYAEHPPTFKPELAESSAWSDDGKVLTVLLRQGLRWSDGEPITAHDVVWTHSAQVDPDVAWAYAQSKDSIERVEAIDDRTVVVHFSRNYSSRMTDLNEGAVLPKHAWSKLPFSEWRGKENWFIDNLVASGPFVVARIEPQHQIVLDRNPNYFKTGYPLVDRVVFRVIPDRTNRVEHLLAGEVDFVEHVPPDRAAQLKESPQVDFISYWHRQYTYVAWNACRDLFADREVRRAMTLAIDRQSLIEALWGKLARPAVSPVLSSIWAFDHGLEAWPYDPHEARHILATAGWRDSDGDGWLDQGGRKFSFELSTNGDNRLRADAAVLIQDQLRRIGVDAQVRLLEFNTLIANNEAHEFDATIGAWAIDTSMDLKPIFHSESIDDGYNFGCYSSAEADREIELARRQLRAEDALPHLHRIQELLHRDQPYTFLWEPMRLCGVSRRLRDSRPNPLSALFNLDEWWLDER